VTSSAAKAFVASERAGLCDLFDQVGPDHPTLCEGWLTHDLAAHLWVREADPIGAVGIAVAPLAGLNGRRMAETKRRWSYTDLVERIRNGPPRLSVYAIPGVEEAANTAEYFVHHEDVRRAGDAARPARALDSAIQDWMWRRLGLLARVLFRHTQIGVVLERSGSTTDDGGPQTIRAVPGSSTVTVVGQPSELLIFTSGRQAAAEVELIGEPAAVDILNAAQLRP
jgi:uncharacterized protein (TIGR03085 family)